ncbi:Flagellar biosynthesis/type III secretory pathway protein [Erythrobacter dokdonensis DSW-74]|uniref:Flagellar assembly protein FliH n=1 Tax=Erythrobacter dokdonensis DSW-74 TaxID=1300349 RepID=A0A1A7BGR3_9SPHN|nr:Flagellar biosynthesis/type III secretory pathway protein [Erythrobacter dokdonensis DSW-74]
MPEAAPAPPGWLAALAEPADFRDAMPFSALAPEPAAAVAPAEAEPEAVRDSAAEDALALAYAEGEAAGRMAALAEAERDAARQRALRLAFRALDEAARDVLAQDLADTVIALCGGVLEDHATDRDALLARCHAAAARIGGAPTALRLHLHPEDIAALGPEALADWSVIADSALERGGLLLEGPDGAVRDGPQDWRRTIAAAVRG